MTVATNALLERKGAKVGLLTTAGHRDVLEMREGLKPERYNMRIPRPEPLVPRHLRLGVTERIRPDGRIEKPLDRDSLNKAIATLKRAKVDSVAVCYLHAYRDDCHERETRDVLATELPERLRLPVIGGVAADQGIPTRIDHRGERVCRASDPRVPARLASTLGRGGFCRSAAGDALSRRGGAGRGGGADRGGHRVVRSRRRRRRRSPRGRDAGGTQPHSPRHGRHLQRTSP